MTINNEVFIRKVLDSDYQDILALNQSEIQYTSAMDLEKLKVLDSLSAYHKVALINKDVTAFIMAMKDHVPYKNDNYDWFASRYDSFLYIDRIVVARDFRDHNIGSLLYNDLFNFARENNINLLACEINIAPPNEISLAFHQKHGFCEVGRQWLDEGEKQVSMQLVNLAG